MNRAKTLEERVAALEKEIEALKEKRRGWQKLNEAASCLGISSETLRDKIQYAKKFPKQSPFKKGIHWRQVGTPYQVHVENWEKAINN